jgi:transposase
MRFVLVKTAEQQNMQTMHPIRAELIEQRTAKANQIH